MWTQVVALLALLAAAAHAQITPDHYPPDMRALMNFSVDPCEDFYDYACGTWISNFTLPPQDPIFDLAISTIEQNNQALLLRILHNASTSTQYPKIIDFFGDCMDTVAIDALGHTPFDAHLPQVTGIASADDLMHAVATLHSFNLPALFSFSVVPDPGPKNPELLVVQLDQGGLNLPDQSLYNASTQGELLMDYTRHITTMLGLAAIADASTAASAIVEFEAQIAAGTLPRDETRDPLQLYNYLSIDQLQALTPHMPWQTYFKAVGLANVSHVIVTVPIFFKALDAAVGSASPRMLNAYTMWCLLHNTAGYLSTPFVNETFNFFGKVIDGEDVLDARDVTCLQATDAALGDILGEAFSDQAFSPASQAIIIDMVTAIEDAFRSTLETLPWMDNVTRAAALVKLSQVVRRVGRKSNPSTYPGYNVIAGQYYESVLTKSVYDFAVLVQSVGQPPDPNAWEMTADTVNAYYEPTSNSINFPAGILQPPFFSIDRYLAQNYGGIGMVMGHENTHGYDDQGRLYDGHGKLDNWWQPDTLAHFLQQASCLAAQYSRFEVLPGVFVNGNQTLGENIADNGGILTAYNAYTARATTPDYPLFFVAYAQGWCSKATPEFLSIMVKTDVHSPPRFRVLGPLMNLDYFSQTFSCPAGSPMNPATKCKVW